MSLLELQNEVNHLLFLYFTSIGVIQRDAELETIDKTLEDLIEEIIKCKNRLDILLNQTPELNKLPLDFYETVEKGKQHFDDGLEFIDSIL